MSYIPDDYEPVEERIRAFYADHPNGRITTELLHYDGDGVTFRASVWRDVDPDPLPWATGHAHGLLVKPKALEFVETVSIGRALANANYAKQGARMSREESEAYQEAKYHDVGRATGPLAKDRAQTPATEGQRKFAKVLLGSTDTGIEIVTDYLGEYRPVELWTKYEASQIIDRLKTAKDEQLSPARTSTTVGDDWHLQEPPNE